MAKYWKRRGTRTNRLEGLDQGSRAATWHSVSATLSLPQNYSLRSSCSGLATRFPLFSAVVSSSIFLLVSLLMIAACVLPMMQWAPTGRTASIDGPLSDMSSKLPSLPPVRRNPARDSDSDDEKLPRRRVRSRSTKRGMSSSRALKVCVAITGD